MAKKTDISIKSKTESHWMSASDLMSGLMMTFMLIALAYMINAAAERDSMKEVAKTASKERDKLSEIAQKWAEAKIKIYNALLYEFENDLTKWHAEIEPDSLIVRFKEPTVLFHKGKVELTNRFKEILTDFFPRYLSILKEFSQSVSEIRIEGHTSSEWNDKTSKEEAYIKNMKLSHGRTVAVLTYCLAETSNRNLIDWGKSVIMASGMSSSRRILKDGIEDMKASRRVEFRVRTKADENLSLILEASKEFHKSNIYQLH